MIGWIEKGIDLFKEKPAPSVVQTSLFYRDKEFGLANLPFDLLIDESHNIEFDITEHAVENGTSIADHVQERLKSVVITGMFSNHSLKDRTSGWVSYGTGTGEGVVNSEPDEIEIEGLESVSNTAYERLQVLKEIARRRNPVSLYTALEDFELENVQMVIESLSYDRGPNDGESIKFTLKLKEVRKARTQSIYVDGVQKLPDPPETETDAQKKTDSKKSKGKKQAIEKTTQTIYRDGLNPKEFTPKGEL